MCKQPTPTSHGIPADIFSIGGAIRQEACDEKEAFKEEGEEEVNKEFPIRATNGMVIVEELPFRPSKILECITHDKADRTESMVVAIDSVRYGRRFDKKKGWEHNGITFGQDLKVGDRVIHKGSYQDDDCFNVNGKKYRAFSPWDIVAIIDKPQPEGFEDPKTGEMLPDKHPLLIH